MLRTAVYCRISTDREDQMHSLESQKQYFESYVLRQQDWQLVNIYADEGITGTSTKKRKAFQQMMRDAEKGLMDQILTKEISRFARNTLDSIYYTRKLKAMGVGVLFMNDGIHTMDRDAELRLTILSSIAQEESRKTSERVSWGQRRSMEQGVVFGRNLLGYDVHNGRLWLNPEGAETVRLIFHKFVEEGKGSHTIARELKEAGVLTPGGKSDWSNTAVLRILRNEKYCGDLVQQKSYTPCFLDHEKRVNHGEQDLIVIRNHHESIVDRALFERAAKKLAGAAVDRKSGGSPGNRCCFSGRIRCGTCGRTYVSRSRTNLSGRIYRSWRCGEAARYGRKKNTAGGESLGCSASAVNEQRLKEALMQIQKENSGMVRPLIGPILKIAGRVVRNTAQHSAAMEFSRETEQETAAPGGSDRLIPIRALLEEIVEGRTWDDNFYAALLENMTVEKDRILCELKYSSQTWAIEMDSNSGR